ncbi:MAG: transposase [Kouleothrix sp.]|nr:transposase [Kouleothrix sp.]
MKYDPALHHRRSIRLSGYDYTQAGAYFVTACTAARRRLFGELVGSEMRLSRYGAIALECWEAIPEHCPRVELDAFVVMPDHIHGILVLPEDADRARVAARERFSKPVAGSLPTIVRLYKAAVTRQINEWRGTANPPVWQRNYYEHVIRSQAALERIRAYIVDNPSRSALDQRPEQAG